MKNLAFASIIFLFFNGCVTTITKLDVADLRTQLNTVNITDGVNSDEAKILAMNYMLDNGNDEYWIIAKPKVTEDGNKEVWTVSFPPIEDGWGSSGKPISELKIWHLMPFMTHINKQTGQLSITTYRVENGKLHNRY